MTSDKERREIARRLRAAAKTKSNNSDYLWRRLEIAVNGWKFGGAINGSYTFNNDVLARLADLIEPAMCTTTFTLDEQSKDGEEVYPTRWWKCARCGEETIMLYDEGAPVACPYCGAKVADDGERGDAL